MQQFPMRVKKWDSSAAKRLNNSRVVPIFIQSIYAGERMGGTVEFSSCLSCATVLQTCRWCWTQGKKKELRLFDSRHKPRKWKDRLRWLKALGRQLIFFSHPLHPHPDGGHGLSTECTNIDETVAQIFCATTVYLLNINNLGRARPTNGTYETFPTKSAILPKKHI